MEIHDRNDFRFAGDLGGPPTAPQLRATSREPGGQYVLIGNPVSWLVSAGRAFPFISLRGGRDAHSEAVRDAMAAGAIPGDVPMSHGNRWFENFPSPTGLDPSYDDATELPRGMRKPGLEKTLFGGQAPLVDTTPGGNQFDPKHPPANVKPPQQHKATFWGRFLGRKG